VVHYCTRIGARGGEKKWCRTVKEMVWWGRMVQGWCKRWCRSGARGGEGDSALRPEMAHNWCRVGARGREKEMVQNWCRVVQDELAGV
jgi:hypothetical protein